MTVVAGPMPGYVSMRSAVVWVQTDQPAVAVIEHWPGTRVSDRAWSAPTAIEQSAGCTAKIPIEGLAPNTVYTYRVWLDGAPVEFDETLQFHTQKLWHFRTSPPAFELALGSCAFVVDPLFDRPGEPFGGGYEIFDSIADRNPELMLWLGDNVYLREADYVSPGGIDARYRQVRTFPPLQRLLRSTHHVATWDDHDYGPNNSNSAFALKEHSLATFARYWPNPSFGLPGLPGVFTWLSYADVDFFLLDDRWYRDSDEAPHGPDKSMLGAAQLAWLKNGLLASDANFKLIACGSQLLDETSGAEGWHRFPEEREDFLDWFRQARPEGVILLSGDRHTSKLCRLEESVPYPLYEFTCSPLASRPRTPNPSELPSGVVDGTVVDQRNFGTMSFAGRFRSRVLTVRCHDSDGDVLWTHEIRHRDLR